MFSLLDLSFVSHKQIFKEEEESIQVNLHEGCGRIKLFWLMALADANTLKAIVEFKSRTPGLLTSVLFGGANSEYFQTSSFSRLPFVIILIKTIDGSF